MKLLQLLGRLLLFFYHLGAVGYIIYIMGDYVSSKEADLYVIFIIAGLILALGFSLGAHLVNLFKYIKNFSK